MLGWFHALMPREERFFSMFARHSSAILAGASALRAMMQEGADPTEHCRKLMASEQEADGVTRDVLIAVRRTFITPFDRGDISGLITAMDDSIDQMQQAAKTILLFDVRRFTSQMREIADVIVQCAELVHDAIPLLSSLSNEAGRVVSLTEKITQLEGQADEIHDRGLGALYKAHADGQRPMEFVIGSTIYEQLEMVVDRFDDVANKIHSILIDHL